MSTTLASSSRTFSFTRFLRRKVNGQPGRCAAGQKAKYPVYTTPAARAVGGIRANQSLTKIKKEKRMVISKRRS